MGFIVELVVFVAVVFIGMWITEVHFGGDPAGYVVTGLLAGKVEGINVGVTHE